MNLNTKEAVSKSLDEVENRVEESIILSAHGSNIGDFNERNDSVQDGEEMARSRKANNNTNKTMKESVMLQNVKTVSYYEAQKYIDNVKDKMLIVKVYRGATTAI
jgi:hypothetical protein